MPPDAVRATLAALLLAAAAAAPAAAAASEPDLRTVPLEDLLDPKIGAVSLEPERLSEAPASAVVLTAEDLRAFGFRTLAEALGSVPGLFTYRDDFFAMSGVRGLGLLMDYGTRLLVLVDGHPLGDSMGLGGALLGRDFPVPIDAVKRIEIVKGPVGSLYGPSAFLGVVNVVTADPDDRASALRVSGATSGERSPAGETSGVLTVRRGEAGITAAFSGHVARGDAQPLPELALPHDGRPGSPGTVQRGPAAGGAAYLRARWRALTVAGACGGTAFETVTAAYVARIGDPGNTMSSRHCFGSLAWRRTFAGDLAIATSLSYDERTFRDAVVYDPPPGGYGRARDLGRDRWLSGDLHVSVRPHGTARLIAGATVQAHDTLQRVWSDDLPSTGEDPENGYGPGDIEKEFVTLNAYLQLEQRLPGDLHVDLGATLYWHGLYGGRFTPKAALLWAPTARDTVKAVYAQGFRAPTVSEAFYEDGDAYLANPDLRPETAASGELIYERRVGAHVTLAASGFLNRYDQLVRFVTVPAPEDPSGTRQQGVNQGSLLLRGAELSATVRWGRWLRGHGGVSVQSVGDELVNFPAVTGNLALATRALWEPLSLAAVLRAASGRAKDPDNRATLGARVDASFALDLAAELEVPGAGGLVADLSVTNLLETAGPDPLLADNAPVTEFPASPRTFRLGLTWRFE